MAGGRPRKGALLYEADNEGRVAGWRSMCAHRALKTEKSVAERVKSRHLR